MTHSEDEHVLPNMTPRSKYVLIGCALLAVLAALAVAGVLALAALDSSVEGIEVALSAPAKVRRGDAFQISARVRNTASNTQRLVDLDIERSYLRGIAIRSAEPPWKESTDLLVLGTSYTFDLPIEPGQELVLVLQATALHSGDFSGDFDFCINSEVRFLTQQARTVVGR